VAPKITFSYLIWKLFKFFFLNRSEESLNMKEDIIDDEEEERRAVNDKVLPNFLIIYAAAVV